MEYINLGQISTITNGKRNAQDAIENGLYPLFDRSVIVKRSDKYMFDKEAIIVAGEGKTFLPKYYKGKFDLHQRCYAIFDFANGIHPKYIYYYIQWNQAYFQSVYTGSTVPSLRLGNFENMPVKLCTANHQEQIAINLDNINLALSKKQQELSSLDELVKSRFIEMFIGKGFERCKIKYLVDRKITTSKKGHLPTDLIKYIDISSIDNQKNEVVSYTEYKLLDAPSRAQQCLMENDILVSTVRPNLKNIAINRYNDNNIVGSSGFCVLRSTLCNPLYLLHCILTDDFTTQMTSLTSGASYPAIRDNDVIDYEVINPPIELQNEFAEFVKLIDKSKFIVQQQIKDLQELLDSKMDEYFR